MFPRNKGPQITGVEDGFPRDFGGLDEEALYKSALSGPYGSLSGQDSPPFKGQTFGASRTGAGFRPKSLSSIFSLANETSRGEDSNINQDINKLYEVYGPFITRELRKANDARGPVGTPLAGGQGYENEESRKTAYKEKIKGLQDFLLKELKLRPSQVAMLVAKATGQSAGSWAAGSLPEKSPEPELRRGPGSPKEGYPLGHPLSTRTAPMFPPGISLPAPVDNTKWDQSEPAIDFPANTIMPWVALGL
jgi:hypothetical protein